MPDVLPDPHAPCTIIGARRTTYRGHPAWELHVRLGVTPLPDAKGKKMLDVPQPAQLMVYCARYVLDAEVSRRTDTTYTTDSIRLPFNGGIRPPRPILGIGNVPETHLAWSNPNVSATPPTGYPINAA